MSLFLIDTRFARCLHNKQLHDQASGTVTELFRRSIFGYIAIYNRLPQEIVDIKSVKAFQARLQSAIVKLALNDDENWRDSLNVKDRVSNIAVFQSRFK